MSSVPPPTAKPRRSWAGIILSTLPILFLTMDGVMKFVKPEAVIKGTVELGYPVSTLNGIGAALLLSTVLYALPRTAFLGALLLTGYLGGAVATHVRVGNPLFTHILFPVYVALLVWGGLWFRDSRVRELVAGRRTSA